MTNSSNPSQLLKIVSAFAGRRLLVLGDLMVDEYLYGSVRRISPEGPVMVLEVDREDWKPGGAANVANNLLALGAQVYIAGMVGEDEAGASLRAELEAGGICTSALFITPDRPTTRKTRVVAQHQQMLRIDRERTLPAPAAVAEAMLQKTLSLLPAVEGVLVSDYRKGTLSRETALQLAAHCRNSGIPLFANPKPESASWLAGAALISLNQSEAEALAGKFPDQFEAYGRKLQQQLDTDLLVITLGARGLACWPRQGEWLHVPAHAIDVYDVAGAGDTTVCALTLALLGGASVRQAACLANFAGACAVQKMGVATVDAEELAHECQLHAPDVC